MLRIQMIGLALVSALVMGAVAVGSASAAHSWAINGTPLASAIRVHSRDLLLLTDHNPTGGEVGVHCFSFNDGFVGPHALDLLSAITAELLGTNKKITCKFDPAKTGACEASTAPTMEAVNLVWHTQLTLFTGPEVRDATVSGGAGNPGWAVTCKTILGNITDTCTASLFSDKVENVTSGVLELFDNISIGGGFACKIGGGEVRNGAGLLSGDITTESPSSTEKLTVE